jgi:hypothetical protein
VSAEAVYARLRVSDPGRWRAVALAWRRWASLAGVLVTDLTTDLDRLRAAWSGTAAAAASAWLARLRRGLVLFRVLCWQADQAASEFAAALTRARRLLARAVAAAARASLTIDDRGRIVPAGPATRTGRFPDEAVLSPTFTLLPASRSVPDSGTAAVAADLAAAIAVAARADAVAAERLAEIEVAVGRPPASPGPDRPGCTASPAEIARWWAGLGPAGRGWLLVTEPATLATMDGLPTTARDAANRLLLDDRRAELDQALAAAGRAERDRLRELRSGLDALADRLAGGAGTRAYLLRLGLAGEGRAVLALGDPDRADNVLTHVPGMTADLASFGGELSRAARVAERATELGPAASTSAVLWLDYDAPDFVDEAASARRADEGAPGLRRFQEGLRASHEGPPAQQTLVGHSYGSLLVGRAAATDGLVADDVVFVGSPGVGVGSASDLAVPPDHLWSSTSRTDVIQYAAVSPAALLRDLADATRVPLPGPLTAFARPERDLWFGTNPNDPAFGARTFPSAPDAGHLGYWEHGSPSLDALAAITLGTHPPDAGAGV